MAARSGYPGIIYAVSSPAAAANYHRAAGDNASRIFRTPREILQDARERHPLSFLLARGNYPGNFLHYSRVNETIVSALHGIASRRLAGFLHRAEISRRI